ncbi:hypothetical protein [Streptomyces sp. NPDC006638]|uniref:hypothetical protein n=1 Tax=Streptomyces sp. NPDC006638 TaxID=3157183 RepID=UPI0033BF6B7C
MSRVIRTLALSGAAAVAVLATAGSATADSPESATAVVQAAAESAAGAPVTFPSGKVLRVTGMDSVSYRADAAHRTTVVTLADGPANGWVGSPPATNGLDPREGSTGPQTQTGTFSPQEIQTTSSTSGAIGVTAVAALILGFVVWVLVKKEGLKISWAVACTAFGVVLAPTFVGPLVGQLLGSGVSAFGNIWSGL